jgi:N-acetylmuramoyl-L-alanine amidase
LFITLVISNFFIFKKLHKVINNNVGQNKKNGNLGGIKVRIRRILKKGIHLIISIIVAILLFNINSITAKAYMKIETINTGKKTIMIDPGHGGIDGGAVSKNGTIEKDINLKISLKLKKQFEDKGIIVLVTREKDEGLYSDTGRIRDKKNEDLQNRCSMKGKVSPDVFISIHLNMFQQSQYYGAQVWYSKEGEEAVLAHIIQQNFIKDLDNSNNRREKCAKGAYKLLRCHENVPSILVECGFLSNSNEEEKLKSDTYQEKIAVSIANSLEEFFNMKEGKEKEMNHMLEYDDEVYDNDIYDELDEIYTNIE